MNRSTTQIIVDPNQRLLSHGGGMTNNTVDLNPVIAPATVDVCGSWGTLQVCPTTGEVIALTDEPESYVDDGIERRGYRDVICVDVAEWIDHYDAPFKGADILDVGFWMKDGTYWAAGVDYR